MHSRQLVTYLLAREVAVTLLVTDAVLVVTELGD